MGVTVRQKVKGRGKPWWVFITYNGRRTSRMVGDKAAAEAVATKIRAKLKLGEFNFEEEKKSAPLFRDFAERFMNTYSTMNHKAATRDSYRSALDVHLNPYFGKKPIDSITRRDVKDFISTKLGE